MKKIFIGRKGIIRDFEHSLKQTKGLSPLRKALRSLLKRNTEATQPRIFFFSGDGGFGKSYLSNELLRIAGEQGFKAIKLDLSVDFPPGNREGVNIRQVIEVIYGGLKKELPNFRELFREYEKIKKEHKKIQRKIDENSFKHLAIEAAGETGGSLHSVAKMPAQVIGSMILDSFGDDLPKWLIGERILSEEEVALFGNADRGLGESLASALQKAAQKTPLCLLLDTFESVDLEPVVSWMSRVFIPSLFRGIKQNLPPLVMILAGRNDHNRDLRENIDELLLYHQDMAHKLFNLQEIQLYAHEEQINPAISEEEAKLIHIGTGGIPLIVKEIFTLLKPQNHVKPIDREQIFQDLQKRQGSYQDKLRGVIERFLKYKQDPDRDLVFQIALLRRHNNEILRQAWNLDNREYEKEVQLLAQRHSFLNSEDGSLQDKIKELLFLYLLDQLSKDSLSKPIILELAKEITKITEDRFQLVGQKEKDISSRYSHPKYREAWLDYCQVLLISNPVHFLQVWPSQFLEGLMWDRKLIEETILLIKRMFFILKLDHDVSFRYWISESVLFPEMSHETSKLSLSDEENIIFSALKEKSKDFNPLQQKLFFWLSSELCLREKDFSASLDFLNKSQDLSDKGEECKQKINRLAFILAYEAYDENIFHLSLTLYNRYIDLNPEDPHPSAYLNRGNTYCKLERYEEALADYSEAIRLNPEGPSAYVNRGNTYDDLERYEEALADYSEAIRLNPEDPSAYYNRGITYDDLECYEEALADYSEAIRLNPEDPSAYLNRGNTYPKLERYEEGPGRLWGSYPDQSKVCSSIW